MGILINRLHIVHNQVIFLVHPLNPGKERLKLQGCILQAEARSHTGIGHFDPRIKGFHQFMQLPHVLIAYGGTEKSPLRLEAFGHGAQAYLPLLHMVQHMICNDAVVKILLQNRAVRILQTTDDADAPLLQQIPIPGKIFPGLLQHSLRTVCQRQLKSPGKPVDILLPQQPRAAAQFQNPVIFFQFQALVHPVHPLLGICAVVMNADPLLQIGRDSVLLLHLFFLRQQVQQPEQEIPLILLPALFHHLDGGNQLFQLILFLLQKRLLLRKLQFHILFPENLLNFLQGKSQIFQHQNPLQNLHRLLIVIPVSCLRMAYRFQQAL